jgi:hypothetical protein
MTRVEEPGYLDITARLNAGYMMPVTSMLRLVGVDIAPRAAVATTVGKGTVELSVVTYSVIVAGLLGAIVLFTESCSQIRAAR